MTRKDAVLLGPLLGSFFELLSRYRVGHIPRRQRLNRAQKIRLVGAININNLNGYIRGDVANNDWFENSFCESIVNVEDLQAWRHKETPFKSRKSRGFGWQAIYLRVLRVSSKNFAKRGKSYNVLHFCRPSRVVSEFTALEYQL